MERRKVIFFDVDGVLLEWFKPFLKYLHEMNVVHSQFDENVPMKLTEMRGYNMEKHPNFAHLGKDLYRHMKDFIGSEQWEQLKPLAILSDLEVLKNCGYELRVLSQVTAKIDRCRRAQQVTRHFGPVFTDMHFTCWRTKKENFIKQFAIDNDCDVWLLDDKPDTVQAVAELARFNHPGTPQITSIGICNNESHPYLYDTYWTMQKRGVNFTWCKDVKDFVDGMLKEKYGVC